MSHPTAEHYAQRVFDLNLIEARDLNAVWSQFGTRNVPGDEFLKALVRRELLTNYQVERLVRGEKTGFFYGDYKVLYLVGAGTFARVYRAVHKDTGQVVAVKVLRKRHADAPLQLARFLREGEMGKTLQHPNIVPIYGVYSVRREYFIVMAFVEGQSLREFVRLRKKVEPLEATQIMVGVMSGLTYAFNKGITHRDLKLSNVLLSSDGTPHLVDFGLAVGMETEHGVSNARSVDYAGLEKLTGVPKDDPRSDIYFAGCMYYHLLTGHPPLTESKDRLQRTNISRFREVIPIRQHEPHLPTVVEQIVEKCMSLTVSERYSRPVDVQVDLQKAVNALKAAAEQGDPSGSTLSLNVERTAAVFLIESNPAVQDAVRAALKKRGYHVLVLVDPDRAWDRILETPDQVGCLVVSTVTLGKEALNVYRNVRAYPRTQAIPTVLLLGKSHASLQEKLGLPTDQHRAVVMPLRVSEVVDQVQQLFTPTSSTASISVRQNQAPLK